jgi:hypothetical protein
MMWTGVAGQQLKRLKTERRYLALERAECRFFFYVPKMRTRAKMQIAASDRAGRRWRPGTGFKPGKGRFFQKNGMKKPCTYCTGIHHLGFQFQKGLG